VFARLGRVMARARWVVIGGWAVIAIAGAVFAGPVFDRLTTVDSLSPDAESARAQRRVDQLAPEGPVLVAVVQGVQPYDQSVVTSVMKASTDLRRLSGVKEVEDLYGGHGGQIGADNNSSLIRVELEVGLTPAEQEALEDRVVARLHQIAAPRVLVGGESLAERAFGEQATADAALGESIALVVLLVALVVIFGGVLAGAIPLAVAFAAVAGTLLGLFGLLTLTRVSDFAVNVVTLLGIGLAVDYSLLLVARYREHRADQADQANQASAVPHPAAGSASRPRPGIVDAIAASMATAGRAVLVSGLAVAAALAGLYVFAEPLLAAMALGGALVVVLATAVALTLVPALLAVAGRRIPPAGATTWVTTAVGRVAAAASSRLPRRASARAVPRRERGLARLAAWAQRRPGPVALGVTGGLLILALPFLGANLANSDARAMPQSMEVRQAYDAMQAGFNDHRAAPVVVVADVDPGSPALLAYLNQLNRLTEVFRLELRRDVPPGATIVDLTPKGPVGGLPSRTLVRQVRAIPTPFPVLVGGEAAELVDYQRSVAHRLPVAALVVLLATGVLLFGLTGSVVVPVKALLLNVLTLLATLGLLVVVFQWGWGGVLLGFQPWGAIDLTTPLLLFVFIFGLSMDYEVFLLARIKEEWDRHRDNDRAVLAGIAKTGPVITSAAVCIGIVFLGFVLGALVPVKEIGFGMAVAVLLDVTVVRGLLLPAVMTLLGDWNWWAPRLTRGGRRSGRPGPPRPRRAVEQVAGARGGR
jgi:RND superfamily putative drug exporter